jgi:hypothetical protein
MGASPRWFASCGALAHFHQYIDDQIYDRKYLCQEGIGISRNWPIA